jgi:hypothetical protein
MQTFFGLHLCLAKQYVTHIYFDCLFLACIHKASEMKFHTSPYNPLILQFYFIKVLLK